MQPAAQPVLRGLNYVAAARNTKAKSKAVRARVYQARDFKILKRMMSEQSASKSGVKWGRSRAE
jgi:hypothetical protein